MFSSCTCLPDLRSRRAANARRESHSNGVTSDGNGVASSSRGIAPGSRFTYAEFQAMADLYGVKVEAMQVLSARFPESPLAEIARYLKRNSAKGCPIKAEKLLRIYMDWRTNELAHFPETPPEFGLKFRCHGRAFDGTRLVQLVACTVDPAFSPEVHVHFALRHLDAHVKRDSADHITALLDCRGHTGFIRNKNIFDVWRQSYKMIKEIQTYFPERIQTAYIYPTDKVVHYAWKFVKNFVHASTANRIVFLTGSTAVDAATPLELGQYFDVSEISKDYRRFFAGLESEAEQRPRSSSMLLTERIPSPTSIFRPIISPKSGSSTHGIQCKSVVLLLLMASLGLCFYLYMGTNVIGRLQY